jgi:cardiolipin synthase A/B
VRVPLRGAFIGLLIVAAIMAVGLMIVQDHQTLRLRSSLGADDPRVTDYVAALIGSDLTRGNRYDVLTNGDQIFPAMLEAINDAKRRISFETYIYDAGDVARQFTDALERAARRGVRVNLLTDAVGASTMDSAHVKRLRDAGCELRTFNTPRWYSILEVNYRTHRKILVVDGEIGFTGGVGVADQWIGRAQDVNHWRDTQVRLRGPIVRLLEGAFYENFVESGDPVSAEIDPPRPPSPESEGASLLVTSSYSGGSNDLKRLYLLLIASARRTLDITSPYFVTDESTLWAIEDAVGRGVRVRILVEGDVTDALPVKYASRQRYEHLLELGIEIHEYQPTMMHTKVAVIDGAVSMFGSANFDNRSLELNDEINVAVSNRDLAARFLQDFENDLKRSNRLELAAWRQRSLAEKSREHFWSYFGEIF